MMIEDYDGADLLDAAGDKIGTVERSYVDDTGRARFVEVKMGGLRRKHRLVPTDQIERTPDGFQVPYTKDVVEGSPDSSESEDTLEGAPLDEARAYYAAQRDSQDSADAEDTADADQTPAAVPVADVRSEDTPAASTTNEDGLGDRTQQAVQAVREKLHGSDDDDQDDDEVRGGTIDSEIGKVRDLGDVIEVPIVEERLVKQPVVTEVLRIRKSSVTEEQTVSGDLRKEDVEVEREGDTGE